MGEGGKAAALFRVAKHDLEEARKGREFVALPFVCAALTALCEAVGTLSATEAASAQRLANDPGGERRVWWHPKAPPTDGRLRLLPLTIVEGSPPTDTHAWGFVGEDGRPCGSLTQAQYEAVVGAWMENALRCPAPLPVPAVERLARDLCRACQDANDELIGRNYGKPWEECSADDRAWFAAVARRLLVPGAQAQEAQPCGLPSPDDPTAVEWFAQDLLRAGVDYTPAPTAPWGATTLAADVARTVSRMFLSALQRYQRRAAQEAPRATR